MIPKDVDLPQRIHTVSSLHDWKALKEKAVYYTVNRNWQKGRFNEFGNLGKLAGLTRYYLASFAGLYKPNLGEILWIIQPLEA